MGLTSVAVCGIVPVAAIYSAGIVAWRISCRHYRGTTTALVCLLVCSFVWSLVCVSAAVPFIAKPVGRGIRNLFPHIRGLQERTCELVGLFFDAGSFGFAAVEVLQCSWGPWCFLFSRQCYFVFFL